MSALPVFTEIAEQEYRPAPRRASVIRQDDKILWMILVILTRLFRTGDCRVVDVDAEAKRAGLTGRCILQISCGLGGQGGLDLYRSGDNQNVLAVRENVGICIKRLGVTKFNDWLVKEGISGGEFGTWFRSLPTI